MKRWLISASGYVFLTTAALAQGLTLPGPGLPIVTGGGGGTPTYVQGNTAQPGDTASTPVTLTSAVGVGNMVVSIYCGAILSSDIVTFTDDKGNVYVVPFAANIINTHAGFGCQLGYLLNATNGPKTIIANNNNSRSFTAIVADEWSNILAFGAVDGTPQAAAQTAAGTGANAIKSATVTTTANGDLIYGFVISINSTGMSFGTGFTGHQNVSSTFYTEGLVQTTAGAVAATFTATSATDDTIAFTIAFKHS